MRGLAQIEFERATGYKIDNTHPFICTYWHMYEEVGEAEYYRNYCEWVEKNCAILTEAQCKYIYFHMPVHIKKNEEDMPSIKIKSILKL
jgi:hypothetical protein